MRAALKRIPTPLLVAELGAIAVGLFGVARMLYNTLVAPVFPISGMELPLVGGSRLAISLLVLVGTAQLARRLAGTGSKVAAVAAALFLAYQLLTMCQILTGDGSLLASREVSSSIEATFVVAFAAVLTARSFRRDLTLDRSRALAA